MYYFGSWGRGSDTMDFPFTAYNSHTCISRIRLLKVKTIMITLFYIFLVESNTKFVMEVYETVREDNLKKTIILDRGLNLVKLCPFFI